MVSIIFILLLLQLKTVQWEKPWLWVFNGLGSLFLTIAVFFFPMKAGLWENHVPGVSRAPYFSEACAKDVLEKEGSAPVFTNIRNGGYLLNLWFPHKRVFVDGFFAPHLGQAFRSYNRPLLKQKPDLLLQKHGIRRAMVTHRDLAWLSLFSTSLNWYPESIDEGMMVFLYQPDWDQAPQPRVLLSLHDFEKLSDFYKAMFSNRFLEIPASLVAKGRMKQATIFLEENKALVERAKVYAEPFSVEQLSRNLEVALEKYDGENNKTLHYELLMQKAIRRKDPQKILEFGNKIWEQQPDINLGIRLASACMELGNMDQGHFYLNSTQKMLMESDTNNERLKIENTTPM